MAEKIPRVFMTVTFRCKPFDAARPQLVRHQDNSSFYRIIKEYHKLSGIPCVINTSFNVHEEPIVRSPDDAIRAFVDSRLDYPGNG